MKYQYSVNVRGRRKAGRYHGYHAYRETIRANSWGQVMLVLGRKYLYITSVVKVRKVTDDRLDRWNAANNI